MQISTRLPPVIFPIRRTEGRAATSAIPPMTQLGASRAKTMALLLSLGAGGKTREAVAQCRSRAPTRATTTWLGLPFLLFGVRSRLSVGMPLTKQCPDCGVRVHIRQKVCEHCHHAPSSHYCSLINNALFITVTTSLSQQVTPTLHLQIKSKITLNSQTLSIYTICAEGCALQCLSFIK